MNSFQKAMAKVAVIGQDKSKLVDCSDVIPQPKSLWDGRRISAAYPPGHFSTEVEQSCTSEPFPAIPITCTFLQQGFRRKHL